MRPADAKRQMETYIDLGFVRALEIGRYAVTDEFRSKFARDAPNSFKENGEPDGSAASSPDDGEESVPALTNPWGQPILSQAS